MKTPTQAGNSRRNVVTFLRSVSGFTQAQRKGAAHKPNKMATIDPAYTSGRPRVTFDGEGVLSGKAYPYLDSYTPTAGERVTLIPVGTTYLIIGGVV